MSEHGESQSINFPQSKPLQEGEKKSITRDVSGDIVAETSLFSDNEPPKVDIGFNKNNNDGGGDKSGDNNNKLPNIDPIQYSKYKDLKFPENKLPTFDSSKYSKD